MRRITYNLDNVGGISSVLAIPVEHYNRIMSRITIVNCLVSVSTDTFVVSIPVLDNDTFSYEENQQTEDGGELYTINIKGEIPRVDSSPSLIRDLEYGRWIVVCKDKNGQLRCAGTKKVPMDFHGGKSMGSTGSTNRIAFTFSCSQERPSIIVSEGLVIE